MKSIKGVGKSFGVYLLAFLKWVALAIVLGVVCGAAGAVFHMAIDFVTEVRMEHPLPVLGLPVAGVVTFLLYRFCKVELGAGTNLIIQSVTTNEHIPAFLAPLIFAGTTLSHLFGASVGREGAALQLGGSIGHNFGKLLRRDEADTQVLAMCGMSACFAALFGTPLTAAIFVLEVIRVGSIRYNAFLPCVVASYTSYLTATMLGTKPLVFTLTNEIPELAPGVALRVIILAALCAVVAIIFCVAVHSATHLAEKWLKNPYLRIAAGGLLMALLTVIFGLYDYNGAGTDIITNTMSGQVKPFAAFIKIALTAICVGVGFRGGEIVPTMFIGATFGCSIGSLLGLDPDFAAALGLVALFCSAVNCPFASIFLAVELFGTINLPLFVIAIAVSYVLSGYFGLYSSQRIVFSKIKQEVVDRNTE